MRYNNPKILLIFPLIFCLSTSCSNSDEVPSPKENLVASCEGCHTDYAHLQAVFTPDTTEPVGGCGGDAPHYEPFDRFSDNIRIGYG